MKNVSEVINTGIYNIIDWFLLEDILRKKSYQIGYFPGNYQALLQDYVCKMIQSGELSSKVVIEAEHIGTKIYVANNNKRKESSPQLSDDDIRAFKNFMERHKLSNLVMDELIVQLAPFVEVLGSKTIDDFLGKIISPKIKLERLIHILRPRELQRAKQNVASELVFKLLPRRIIKPILNRCSELLIILAYGVYRLVSLLNPRTYQVQLMVNANRKVSVIKPIIRAIFLFTFRSILRAGLQNLIDYKRRILNEHLKKMSLSSLRPIHVVGLSNIAESEDHQLMDCRAIDPSIKKAEKFAVFIFLFGRIYFGLGWHDDACDLLLASMRWGYKRANLLHLIGMAAELSGRYDEAVHAYKGSIFFEQNLSPDIFVNLAHVLIALGNESEAVRFLIRAIRLCPAFSMPHQNLAAQYDRHKYNPQMLDLICHPQNMLYDAYNYIGELAVHKGCGKKGVEFYAKAIMQQRKQSATFHLPREILRKLEDEYLINPEQPIRILPYEWVTLIGHIAMLDSYIKLQKLGMANSGCQVLVLAPKDKVANHYYLSLWQPHVKVIEDQLLIDALFPYQRYFGDCFNGYLRSDGSPGDWTELGAKAQIAWDKTDREPLIKITEELHETGWGVLEKMGLNRFGWFVCLHIRGGGYHRESKHSIQTHRDSSISDYIGAIKAITNQGGWVIRVGDRSMEPLPPMQRVVDYAHSKFKNQWMDVFLLANARFFVGTTSGLTNAVLSLGTSSLLVNCVSNYFQLWNNKVLFTIKPLWMASEQRYMTFSEMTSESFRWNIFNINQLMSMGVYPQCNTPEEITDATLEMMTRLNGRRGFTETEADRILRAECEASGNRHFFGNGRLSESFFRRRQHELSYTSAEAI